jgi:hypothetical protein
MKLAHYEKPAAILAYYRIASEAKKSRRTCSKNQHFDKRKGPGDSVARLPRRPL